MGVGRQLASRQDACCPGSSPPARCPLAPGHRERPHHPVLGPCPRLHPRRLSHCPRSFHNQEGPPFTFPALSLSICSSSLLMSHLCLLHRHLQSSVPYDLK